MKRWTTVRLICGLVAGAMLATASVDLAHAQRRGNDEYFKLGPDSLRQEGVPHGEMKGPFVIPSEAFPGTQHTYWVYVPAQYDHAKPCALMVFQDGLVVKMQVLI